MMACLFWDLLGNQMIESFIGIEACPHSSSTLCDLLNIKYRFLDSLDILFEHVPEGRKLLAEGHWSGILKVCSSYFVNMHKLMRLLFKFLSEVFEARQQLFVGLYHCCDMHYCGKAIVAWLAPINMIIRMHLFISTILTRLAFDYLDGPIGDHFICIHVGLRPWTSLPDY